MVSQGAEGKGRVDGGFKPSSIQVGGLLLLVECIYPEHHLQLVCQSGTLSNSVQLLSVTCRL